MNILLGTIAAALWMMLAQKEEITPRSAVVAIAIIVGFVFSFMV